MIGTGKMGDNARLSIEYTRDDDALPRSLVAKLPAADPVAKQMSASSGALREVLFYQQQAQHTDMHLLKIYYSASDDKGEEFIILMEDMAPAELATNFGAKRYTELKWRWIKWPSRTPFWESEKLEGEHISEPYAGDNPAFGGAYSRCLAEISRSLWRWLSPFSN